VGSLHLSFPLAQTCSYVTALDQSKAVLWIRAMCKASSSTLKQKHSGFLGKHSGFLGLRQCSSFVSVFVAWSSFGIFRSDFFHWNFLQ